MIYDDIEIESYDVGCEKCGLVFEFPIEGGQLVTGEYEGVPLCADCYWADEVDNDR